MTATVNSDEFPLPRDKLPACWHDDERMNSLYAPFRQRNVNPLDWDSKFKFWSSLINDWCIYKVSPSFTLVDLRNAFRRGGRSPMGLATVVETMLKNNDLCKYADFVTVPPVKSWAGWTVDVMLKKPLVWSFNKVVDSLMVTPMKDDECYVNLAAAKKHGEELLAAISDENRDQLYEIKDLSVILAEKTGSVKDVLVAVHWLVRDGKATITKSSDGKFTLVKFAHSTDKKVEITELDLVVDSMKRNEKKLVKKLEELQCDKKAAEEEARNFIKKGMREVAKSSLRKKHSLEKNINSRVAALENVQMLLSRIREAKTDTEVVEAYRMGAAALKAAFKEADLTEDTALHTVTDVEEVLDIHDEIQNTLSQPIGSAGDEDLEGELEALLKDNAPSAPPPDTGSVKKPAKPSAEEEDLEKRLLALRMPNLPDIPSTSKLPEREKMKSKYAPQL